MYGTQVLGYLGLFMGLLVIAPSFQASWSRAVLSANLFNTKYLFAMALLAGKCHGRLLKSILTHVRRSPSRPDAISVVVSIPHSRFLAVLT